MHPRPPAKPRRPRRGGPGLGTPSGRRHSAAGATLRALRPVLLLPRPAQPHRVVVGRKWGGGLGGEESRVPPCALRGKDGTLQGLLRRALPRGFGREGLGVGCDATYTVLLNSELLCMAGEGERWGLCQLKSHLIPPRSPFLQTKPGHAGAGTPSGSRRSHYSRYQYRLLYMRAILHTNLSPPCFPLNKSDSLLHCSCCHTFTLRKPPELG